MKLYPIIAVFLSITLFFPRSVQSAQVQKSKGEKVAFIKNEAAKKVDVMIDGKLFTSFCWPDNVCKPILFPVLTSSGTAITRGFPLKPKTGERADHPLQIGIWLTYGDVNGYDFWGNGSQGLGTKNANGGVIRHRKVKKMSGGLGKGSMITEESWLDRAGKELLTENTEYHFIAKGPTRIIDRITTLKATGGSVTMKDTKEGMFAIRVVHQLELPSKEDVTLTDAHGHPTTVTALSNEGVTGNYISSEGVTGEAVWGTRARWMNLYGSIGDEHITLVIGDHPKNPGFPTYWHARGYGLFAANPLGVKDFTRGKEELNFFIPASKSITFRYRVIIHSGGHLNDTEINALMNDFAKEY